MIQQKLTFYRLHFINRETGQIARTYEFHAADDREAIKFASVWTEGAPLELWGGRGRVMRWVEQDTADD